MVFYLKYRPQTLSELDNRGVAEQIRKYLTKSAFPHAFLFTGSRGTGKTSTARIVAKSINCLKNKTGDACGKCEICVSIARGNNLDVIEIDAASNRGIDEIRTLRETIKLSPTQLKYKVYIIDEVHMLTQEAFNALLKTIEEPPKHAIFILATTEIHKVPATILSRCIKVDFAQATSEDLLHSLKRIVGGEKLTISDEILEEVISISEGSFRDAAKILEDLLLEKDLTLANVRQKIGTTENTAILKCIELMRTKDTKELLELVQKLSHEGRNIRQFFLQVLKVLENILVRLYTSKNTEWRKAELLRLVGLLSDAFSELKTAIIPSLPFEIAIVTYCEETPELKVSDKSQETGTNPVASAYDSSTVVPIVGKWSVILDNLKPYNHSLVGVLRSCKPIEFKDGVLVIESDYKFHAERVADPKTCSLIAKVIKDVVGLDVKIQTVIKKRV